MSSEDIIYVANFAKAIEAANHKNRRLDVEIERRVRHVLNGTVNATTFPIDATVFTIDVVGINSHGDDFAISEIIEAVARFSKKTGWNIRGGYDYGYNRFVIELPHN